MEEQLKQRCPNLLYVEKCTLKKNRWATKLRQSRDVGNIVHKTQNEDKHLDCTVIYKNSSVNTILYISF